MSEDVSDYEAGPSRFRITNKRSRSGSVDLSVVDEGEDDPRGSSVVELSPGMLLCVGSSEILTYALWHSDELVPCPVCAKQTRIADMDAHIGSGCKSGGLKPATKQSDAWNKIFGGAGGGAKGKAKKR